MRRKEREITDKNEIREIIEKADACRIAFAVDNVPYIVCMNYGYEWADSGLVLYFHCAREGKKLEFMEQNNYVCFQMDIEHELLYIPETTYCTMKYNSIVGFGYIEKIENEAERVKGLNLLMNHYGHEAPAKYPDASLMRTIVLRLAVNEISAKKTS